MDSRSSQYKEKDYWNRRYDEEESYEWFQDLHGFQSLLLPLLSLTDQILVLGCGNSNLSKNGSCNLMKPDPTYYEDIVGWVWLFR